MMQWLASGTMVQCRVCTKRRPTLHPKTGADGTACWCGRCQAFTKHKVITAIQLNPRGAE